MKRLLLQRYVNAYSRRDQEYAHMVSQLKMELSSLQRSLSAAQIQAQISSSKSPDTEELMYFRKAQQEAEARELVREEAERCRKEKRDVIFNVVSLSL